MRARRLLVFTENYARGGGNRYCVDLITALSESFDEIVLAANPGGIFAEDVARLPRNAVVVPAPFLTRSRARHALRRLPRIARAPMLALLSLAEPVLFRLNVALCARLVDRHAPAAVLSCNGGYPAARAALAMVVAAHRRGVPTALSVVSMPTPRGRLTVARDRAVDAAVWRAVHLVIVNAQAVANALVALHDMPVGRSRVVVNALSDASAHSSAGSGNAIGFVSRLEAAKGVFVLLDAFAEIASRWPDVRLRLIGKGDASAAVAARVRELGLGDRVDAEGYLEGDIHAELAQFRVYAFPSFHEGLPYSILEAMRAGIPIVSTSVGGIPEVLTHGEDALLVPPRDVAALAAAIERLLADADAATRFGRSARARFERHHRPDRVALEVRRAFAETGMLGETGVAPDTRECTE